MATAPSSRAGVALAFGAGGFFLAGFWLCAAVMTIAAIAAALTLGPPRRSS